MLNSEEKKNSISRVVRKQNSERNKKNIPPLCKLNGRSLRHFSKLKVLEQNKVYTELDNIITVKEISDAIGSLENNKSRSFDSILNEMLKIINLAALIQS